VGLHFSYGDWFYKHPQLNLNSHANLSTLGFDWFVSPIIGRLEGRWVGVNGFVRMDTLAVIKDPPQLFGTQKLTEISKGAWSKKSGGGFFMIKEPYKVNWGSLPNRLSKWNLLL
jgi:hypothetical protein